MNDWLNALVSKILQALGHQHTKEGRGRLIYWLGGLRDLLTTPNDPERR